MEDVQIDGMSAPAAEASAPTSETSTTINAVTSAATKQNFTNNQQEAIQALIRSTLENQGIELEYEDFEGYEVPPRSQFSVMKKPAVSIKNGQMTFNMACIRLFKEAHHIVPLLNSDKKRLAIIPCVEEENASIEWSRTKKDGTLTNKSITSRDFVEKIFQIMGWTKNNRYRVLGRLTNSERGLILVFELSEADEFVKAETVVNPETGKARTRQIKKYPKEFENKIGKDYNEYRAAHEREGMETLDSYASVESILPESGVLVSEIPADAIPEPLKDVIRGIEENANGIESEKQKQA